MQSIGSVLSDLFTPLSTAEKRCDKHGIDYTEQVFKRFTRGCPQCAAEAEEARKLDEAEKRRLAEREWYQKQIAERIGGSRIPLRFRDKTVGGYRVENEQQRYIVERVKAYATEFNDGQHSGRCMALLGNAGTGKTHLACAVGRHVIRNYEAEIKAAAMRAAVVQGWLKSDEPLRVHIGAWFAVPKSWSRKKRAAAMAGNLYPTGKPDADNIAKAVCDALNDIAYHDDRQVVECVIRKRYCQGADDAPHITVFVERMPTMDEMKAEALARETV